jgi:hypothetical protein
MSRPWIIRAVLTATGILSLPAATLEKLSLERMIQESTAIVRGRVISTSVDQRGSLLYTRAKVQVSERWKGGTETTVEVSVPGGRSGNIRQRFAGAPNLVPGAEYLLFLWTGKSGVTQVIGFSQGLFDVSLDAKGQPVAARAASTEAMFDAAGQAVVDGPVRMTLAEMDKLIRAALSAQGQVK